MSNHPAGTSEPPDARSPRLGLANATLVLGILSFFLSVFLFGGILGVIGLALGAVHIRHRRGAKTMAWWGVALSIAGILASIGLSILYYQAYKKVVASMNSASVGTGTDVQQPAASELKQSNQALTPVQVWTKNIPGATALAVGDWDGDGVAEILIAADKRLHVVSTSGTEKTAVPLPDRFTLIEAGRNAKDGVRLLGYSNWGRKVTVVDTTGREIWSYPSATGVDGAHWGDLDGDKTDELIVGMNGGGGLHAVSAEGKQIWATTEIGNVWNQAVIPAAKDRPALIFATEAGGSVRVYDPHGKAVRTLRPLGKYCTQLAAKVVNRDGLIQCLAMGDGRVIAFDEHGKVGWSTPSVQNHTGWRKTTFAAGDVNGDGQIDWVFHERSGDLVVANWRGEKLASIPKQMALEDFAIAPEGGHGLLIGLQRSTVIAYRLDPGATR